MSEIIITRNEVAEVVVTDDSSEVILIRNEVVEVVEAAIQGDPGASAYEIAVEGGFTGTVAEWLPSLRDNQSDVNLLLLYQIAKL